MAIQINNLVREVLEAPSFGFVCAINESKQPVMTRIFGYSFDDPLTILTIYTYKKDSLHVIEQLHENSNITATLSSTADFKTVQFKGNYNQHADASTKELNIIKAHTERQAEILRMMGIPKEVFANWKFEPAVGISINVKELFDQTPKVNAGNKLN